MENPFAIPDLVLTAIGAIAGLLAAYFAWHTYRRKPKLQIVLLTNPLERLRSYSGGGGYFGGQIRLRVENRGKVAAKSIVGLLDFNTDYLMPRSSNEDAVSIEQDEQVKLQIPTLAPSSALADSNSRLRVGEEFAIKVETKQSGQTEIRYRFVSDEGTHIAGTLPITVPSLGDYSEQQLTDFLKTIRDSPLRPTSRLELKATLLKIGDNIGLSEMDLSRLFRDVRDKDYLSRIPSEQSDHFLTITLGFERFHVPGTLQLSLEGCSYLEDSSSLGK